MNLIKKFFGTKNERDIKRLQPLVDRINELEKSYQVLSDEQLKAKTAEFKEGVEDLTDLQPDMILEGVVTNVTNFGAFVDIGVHQDGLVHISALSDKFVKDPHSVVKAGDVVKVKVLEVDLKRRRISLTMRLSDQSRDHASQQPVGQPFKGKGRRSEAKPRGETAMAAAFAKLRK